MSEDETKSTEDVDQAGQAQQPDVQAPPEDESGFDALLQAAQAEALQQRDQHVRALAELENVRKRARRDVEAARKFALEKFATELLGVRDSLEMGLQAAAEKSSDFDSLKDGVEMSERMLWSAMEKSGVVVIDPAGEPFNPEFHEAVTVQETDEHPANTVVSVMQKGYLLNGRVLRPAMVVVSKTPQKP